MQAAGFEHARRVFGIGFFSQNDVVVKHDLFVFGIVDRFVASDLVKQAAFFAEYQLRAGKWTSLLPGICHALDEFRFSFRRPASSKRLPLMPFIEYCGSLGLRRTSSV